MTSDKNTRAPDLRVAFILSPRFTLLPFSGFGLNLTRDDTGGLHMVSTSILVNEPD